MTGPGFALIRHKGGCSCDDLRKARFQRGLVTVTLAPSQWENGVPAFDAATLYPQFHGFQGSLHLRQTNRVKLVLCREAV